MKKLSAITAALILSSMPALAGGLISGGFETGTTSFSATGGASFGNGSSFQEAGHFAGARAEISGGATFTGNAGTMNGQSVTETFSQGHTTSWVAGSSFGGAIEGGFGAATGEVWGIGLGSW